MRHPTSTPSLPTALVLVLISATACSMSRTSGSPQHVWSWHEPNTELYQPAFSHNGSEIAFVRKFHIPDGHEAEGVDDAEMAEIWRKVDANERYADPEVVVVTLRDDSLTPVGWGWSPSFSPDDRALVYAHQRRPSSRLRILASTLEGNSIQMLDRETGEVSTVAEPDIGFLADPLYSPDGSRLVYSIGAAVNGAWPGHIGVGQVDLESGRTERVYPPRKDFGFYQLIDDPRFVDGRLLALRARPAAAGDVYLASAYEYDLIDVEAPSQPLFSWGTKKLNQRPTRGFGASSKGGIVVFDRGWRTLGSQPKASDAETERPVPGNLSPNGEYAAMIRGGQIAVSRISDRTSWTVPLTGTPREIVWSPDSGRVAVVASHTKGGFGGRFLHDELLILTPTAEANAR